MEVEKDVWTELGATPFALLLAAAAFAMYVLAYTPEHARAELWENELRSARRTVARLHLENERRRIHVEALAAGDPVAVAEAARETLRLGNPGETVAVIH